MAAKENPYHPRLSAKQIQRLEDGMSIDNPRVRPSYDTEYDTVRSSFAPHISVDMPRTPYPYEIPDLRKATHWESSHRTPKTSGYRKSKKDKRARRKARASRHVEDTPVYRNNPQLFQPYDLFPFQLGSGKVLPARSYDVSKGRAVIVRVRERPSKDYQSQSWSVTLRDKATGADTPGVFHCRGEWLALGKGRKAQDNPSSEVKALRAKYRKNHGNDWWKDPSVKAAYKAELSGSAPAAPTTYKPKPYTVEAEEPPAPPEEEWYFDGPRRTVPFALSGHLKPKRKPRAPRATEKEIEQGLAGLRRLGGGFPHGFDVGDIVIRAATSGWVEFAQVVKATPKTVTLRRIARNRQHLGNQYADSIFTPIPGAFGEQGLGRDDKPFRRTPREYKGEWFMSEGSGAWSPPWHKWDGKPYRQPAYID